MGIATHCNRHQQTHGNTSIVRVAPKDVSIYCGSVIAEALAIAGVIVGAASFFLVGVKTTIHLFTYSLSGNKIKKWTTFSWSELKQLFTYSPIHLFAYFRGVLGVLNQKGAEACMAARIGRMRQKAAGILVDTVLPQL